MAIERAPRFMRNDRPPASHNGAAMCMMLDVRRSWLRLIQWTLINRKIFKEIGDYAGSMEVIQIRRKWWLL